MILRLSSLFVRTLRDDPADAEVPSHRLLVRAGYIRRAAPGIYTWLPLGLRVLRKIEQIIRDEMDAIGAQELLFPALLPREPYEASGRWTEYGDGIFRLKDRKGNDYLLGPTHEEMFTLVVKDLYSSYKDLPLSIYQIQTKYRDEARPRAGVLRGREFTMKDSYSFDVDDAGLDASYQKHRDAYIRIFDRLGFDYVIVKAEAGRHGRLEVRGVPGEGRCRRGHLRPLHAVRLRRQRRGGRHPGALAHWRTTTPRPPTRSRRPGLRPSRRWSTTSTRSTRADDRPWAAADTLKNIVFSVRYPDGTTDALAIGLPGDREVDTKRLESKLGEGVVFEPFGEADFAARPSLAKGYIGPGSLGEKKPAGVRFLLDPRIVEGTRWVTGADVDGSHVLDLVAGRDFSGDGLIDVAEVRDGDPCPNGDGGTLESARGIEMGHIFQLGRKYADALGLQVLDENGKLVTVTMGSYGIGPSRGVAAIAENTLDELGLCWPRAVSPADVHIVAAGKDDAVFAAAAQLADDLSARGLTVMYDDRKASPGVKFKDAEMIGVPTIVTVGRGLADGVFEVRDRASGERTDVAVGEAADHLAPLVRG